MKELSQKWIWRYWVVCEFTVNNYKLGNTLKKKVQNNTLPMRTGNVLAKIFPLDYNSKYWIEYIQRSYTVDILSRYAGKVIKTNGQKFR